MKNFLLSLIVILSTITYTAVFAQNAEFIENKGQWDSHVKFAAQMTMGGIFLQSKGYKVLLNNTRDLQTIASYLHGEKNNIAGKSLHDTSSNKLILHSHAYEVTFNGASENAAIIPEKVLNTYNNYFTGKDPSKWAAHCKIYNVITYKNIYPNIDARYYTDKGSLKYDLVVNPGGDVSKIALQYDGVDGLSIKKGNLVIKNSVNDVTELAPASYQINETGKATVDAEYIMTGNIVRFKINNYEKNKILVIDPTEVFCSFTGSHADNWGYTATFDGQGNFYAGGIVFNNGFIYPPYNGAFQTNFAGGDNAEGVGPIDIGIMKFSADGKQRLYATYLGGSGSEQPHSMIVDHAGNLIVVGRTTSPDFPLYPSSTNTLGKGGGFDIFISKLSFDGTTLLGSIKIGGSGNDGVNIQPKEVQSGAESIRRNYGDDARSEVMVDAANNIYLASCTQSTDFPVTPNAFQTINGGMQDGVIIKMNADLLNSHVILSSYLGGRGDDASFVIDLSPATNNIYIGGSTTSLNIPGAGIGGSVISQGFQGGVCDGFVTEITNGPTYNLVNSTYIGTTGDDMLYGLKFDNEGNPYVMGTTTGAWPIKNAMWSTAGGKQFIAKLYPDLHDYQYSTVFGSVPAVPFPNISPIAFLVDRCENVYVSGWGGSFNSQSGYPNSGTAKLRVTPGNGLLPSTDNNDFYFFVLEKDAASQLYGGWFGQNGGFTDHVDGGTSRYDKNGVIYQGICANCENDGSQFPPVIFPTTPGVWSPSNGATPVRSGAECNMAAIKIAFELAGVGSGVQASINGIPDDTSGCAALKVDFTDTLNQGKIYVWDFGDGSKRDTTFTPNNKDSHTYTNIGTYHVTLISIDSSKCNISDTSYTNIRVGNNKAPVSFIYHKLPPCNSLTYQFINTSTAPPGFPFTANSFTWDFGDGTIIAPGPDTVVHSFASSGTYFVKLNLIDTIYCNAPDQVIDTLRIAANVKAQFQTPPFGCAPYDAVFTNTSLAGQQFYWDFGDGTIDSTTDSPTHLYTDPGTYTIKLVAVDTSTCNRIDSTSFTITVSPKPTAAFTFSPVPPIADSPINFVNISSGGTHYLWQFGDGDTLRTQQLDTLVTHIYNQTGTFSACLTAYNDYGCTDTLCQQVQSITVPLLDVPNAFSPNGDGVNDEVHVKGYGFDKFDWRIYNRWGLMVFHSTSADIGWDGRYKGVLQPQEVYTYILNVQYTDGTIYRKTGDITLLR